MRNRFQWFVLLVALIGGPGGVAQMYHWFTPARLEIMESPANFIQQPKERHYSIDTCPAVPEPEYIYRPNGTPKYLFHGGCHGCTAQGLMGLSYCNGCCYRHANWDLPDLNTLDGKL
jgi:hypothetical protein